MANCTDAVMGAEGAVSILHKHEMDDADQELRQVWVDEYNKQFMSPYVAARLGIIDEVISPEQTRRKIRAAFESLSSKERSELSFSHGNIPL